MYFNASKGANGPMPLGVFYVCIIMYFSYLSKVLLVSLSVSLSFSFSLLSLSLSLSFFLSVRSDNHLSENKKTTQYKTPIKYQFMRPGL